jgi:hypothetical protein
MKAEVIQLYSDAEDFRTMAALLSELNRPAEDIHDMLLGAELCERRAERMINETTRHDSATGS